jgi:cyclophilin family peptidyl-prolyl cis-trans isomerase
MNPSLLFSAASRAAQTPLANCIANTNAIHIQRRWFGHKTFGTRGARGHGWYVNYRAGKGGRHLQGEYADRHNGNQTAWNASVLAMGSAQCFFKVAVTSKAHDDQIVEEHLLQLNIANAVLPETCANFVNLITSRHDERTYRNSLLYRMERNVGICGGDIMTNTGRAGRPFHADATDPLTLTVKDPLAMWHLEGTVTMLSSKVDRIDSRFILCTQAAPHLDGMHRAFGHLTPESLDAVKHMQSTLLTKDGYPLSYRMKITDCGVQGESSNSNTMEEQQPVGQQVHATQAE